MNNGWNKTELGLHVNFFKGNGLPKNSLKDDGKYSCIHYGQLFTHYSEAITKIKSKTDFLGVLGQINDVLMPTSDVTPSGLAKASCLKVDNIVIGGDILVIRPNPELDGTFLSFVIKNSKKQVLSLVTGSTVFHLYAKDMAKFKFYIPENKEEQKQVAKVLLKADETIKCLEKLVDKKKLILKGVMYNLLTGKNRLQGFNEIWNEKKFNELFVKINTKKNQIPTSQYLKAGYIPVIDQGKSFISGYSNQENKIIKANNQGLIVYGDHTCNVKFINFNFIVGADGTQVLKATEENDPLFMKYMIEMFGPLPTGYNRHYSILKKIIFKVPKKDEQIKISSYINQLEKNIFILEEKINKVRNIKLAQTGQLLTGKIRLPLN